MQFSVLGSGSRGNCVYIEEGKNGILIDNGFSGKEVEKRLSAIGRSLDNLTAICVTHEHNDHIAGVGVLSRRCKIPVYSNYGTFKGAENKMGKLHKLIEFGTGEDIEIQDLQVRSFRVSHDTADPVGFVVSNGSEYLGYCTDTGKVSKLMELRLAGCHGLILEFNHNLEMLKNGPYPLFLQQRVRSSQGHLSNEDAAEFLHNLMHRHLKVAVLAHLSETNNTPELASKAAGQCFSEEYKAKMVVARQETPTVLTALK
ncbi:MBL fold metallo-hydrolase [Desulfosediminicola flagellatus]|uniref:MBL fold metallo-hydrolase n=1 Tax=Desulfosediminicola flagellatus TaxID=2569541 RepID=UPI0010ACE2DB|nr:MBL fold metallo-hydrolase [Desulfosediminicola flagellatus]